MTEIKHEQCQETGLTNRVNLGITELVEDQVVTIKERSRLGNTLFLKAAADNVSGVTELRLFWILSKEGSSYAIVVHSGRDYEEEPVPPKMVLRVIDQNTLKTVSVDEFNNIASDCRRAIAGPKASEAHVAGVVGGFPPVEI